jgi:biofilm PGA synthesis N-glycosyltransferase PgaC
MRAFFDYLWRSPIETLIIAFLCAHPLGSGLMSMVGALRFRAKEDPRRWFRLGSEELAEAKTRYPVISVVIPAHNEQEVIEGALAGVLALEWPELDVIVIDDGSHDETRRRVEPYARRGQVRLLHKPVNEGKSMAINDALPACRGDLVLLMDADGVPDSRALEFMAPHFLPGPAIAAVTGNPRVLNTSTVLARLQAVEFSSTVAVQRRGDAIWGRLMTFSGLCTTFRRDVVMGLGGFAPDMATEDIEMTWRLQLSGHEVVYEPRALFGMHVPETLRLLWRQRIRWVRGLAQVLRRHGFEAVRLRNWRIWPVLTTAVLSVVWAHVLAVAVVVIGLSEPVGRPPPHLATLVALLGALTLLGGVIQGVIGMWLDRRVDPAIRRQWPWLGWYPLCYWILCVVMVLRGTLPGLVRRPRLSVWQIPRESADPAAVRPA